MFRLVTILISNLFVCYETNHRNWSSIITIKFLLGMFCACITMCIAGSIEKIRQDSWKEGKVMLEKNSLSHDLTKLVKIHHDQI